MSAQTKTVIGHFGPKQLTRDAFVRRWTDHCQQFFRLVDSKTTPAEYGELAQMQVRIGELAGQEWDRLPS